MTLPAAVAGERFTFDGLSCYASGRGAPVLLVHSVNAAASAAEVRPLYDHLSARRAAFALDLPGFGFSDRSDRDYTPRLMTDALHRTADEIARRCGDAPIDVLGVSLGCEFVARAAVERPERWRRLVLVSPTGFNGSAALRRPAGSTREIALARALLRGRPWSAPAFRALTRPGVVRYFLEKTFGGKAIDEAMWTYAVATAREPGAHHAPLQFLTGALFSADIHEVYEAIRQPVWMSHGTRGDFTDYRATRIVEGRPNWRIGVWETGAMPYAEKPREFCGELDAFFGN